MGADERFSVGVVVSLPRCIEYILSGLPHRPGQIGQSGKPKVSIPNHSPYPWMMGICIMYHTGFTYRLLHVIDSVDRYLLIPMGGYERIACHCQVSTKHTSTNNLFVPPVPSPVDK